MQGKRDGPVTSGQRGSTDEERAKEFFAQAVGSDAGQYDDLISELEREAKTTFSPFQRMQIMQFFWCATHALKVPANVGNVAIEGRALIEKMRSLACQLRELTENYMLLLDEHYGPDRGDDSSFSRLGYRNAFYPKKIGKNPRIEEFWFELTIFLESCNIGEKFFDRYYQKRTASRPPNTNLNHLINNLVAVYEGAGLHATANWSYGTNKPSGEFAQFLLALRRWLPKELQGHSEQALVRRAKRIIERRRAWLEELSEHPAKTT